MRKCRFPAVVASLAALLILLGLSAPVRAQDPNKPPDQLRTLSRAELDVIKVLNAQERAWNHANIDAYLSGYKSSPDLLFVADGKVTRGFENLQADYRRNYATKESMGTLTFAELEPHVLDDHYAIVLGKYHVDRTKKAGGPADGMFSLVFEKTDDGWKIVVAHTT